jgi:hypothetical protein
LGASVNLGQIVARMARYDVRALALLRFKIPKLVIPMACIIDYYGIVFEVQSPVPITQNSLVYGSDTDGLLFKNDDPEGVQMAM